MPVNAVNRALPSTLLCVCLFAGLPLVSLADALPKTVASTLPPKWATVPDVPPLPQPDSSGYVEREGANLYYAIYNRQGGEPVLLLHGGMSTSDSWGFEVPKLLMGHQVIVMDARGHGRSTFDPTQSLTYEQMAEDAVAVLDRAGVKQASVVGVSDGGIIGLILAIKHPDRIRRLFAWGANYDTTSENPAPPDPAMKGMGPVFMGKMEAQYRRLSPTPDGFPALKHALNLMYATEPNLTCDDLGKISIPVAIADGQYEQFIDPAYTRRMASCIPAAKLVIIPNVSHGGAQQDPEAFHEAVKQLLRRAPR
jgi:pimeloyl-ACP methyl ester carboxylesterase